MRKEVLRFLVVGFTTVAIDYLTYRVLVTLGAAYSPAKATSFIVGTVFAYFANRFWTFGGHGTSPARGSVPRFAILYATTLLCNVAVNSVLLSVFSGYPFAIQGAFVVATGVSATLNFLGMKYLVFKPHAAGPQNS
jgi:putative flippase GtrA